MYIKTGKAESGAFAEWFSIDPPFPDGVFGDDKLVAGAYCNGGIMPLVGGELAKAALWYFPDGMVSAAETSTSPDATPTDGWGSSAMLYALAEGLAGVIDLNKEFKSVRISPRWEAANVAEAEVMIDYPASDNYVKYFYSVKNDRIGFEIEGSAEDIEIAILLPINKKVVSSNFSGAEVKSVPKSRAGEKYFRCKIKKSSSRAVININLSATL